MRALRVAFVTFALMASGSVTSARADEIPSETPATDRLVEQLKELVAPIEGSPAATEAYNRCPAKWYGSRYDFAVWLSRRMSDLRGATFKPYACVGAPGACWRLCKGGEGLACTDLGRVMERFGFRFGREAALRLWSLGCEAGDPAGCTSRGATIGEGMLVADPLAALPPEVSAKCSYDLFSLACGEKDAWGCTMLGLAHAQGDGTTVDFEQASAAFDLACDRAPDGDACTQAREWRQLFRAHR